jgi:hypothetical protein
LGCFGRRQAGPGLPSISGFPCWHQSSPSTYDIGAPAAGRLLRTSKGFNPAPVAGSLFGR